MRTCEFVAPSLPPLPQLPGVALVEVNLTIITIHLSFLGDVDCAGSVLSQATASLQLHAKCVAPHCKLELNCHTCSVTPAAVCAGPRELCFYDPACDDPHHPAHAGGLGCNAGGVGQFCRFCGFDAFEDCPSSSAVSGSGRRRLATTTKELVLSAAYTMVDNAPGSEARLSAVAALATSSAEELSRALSLPITG